MSTQRAQGMLLFLVLAVDSARVQILRSYTLLTLATHSNALLMSLQACQPSLLTIPTTYS